MASIVLKYVDGILKLHSLFKSAILNFLKFFEKSGMPQKDLFEEVLILVDFGESQPENKLKGYLIVEDKDFRQEQTKEKCLCQVYIKKRKNYHTHITLDK